MGYARMGTGARARQATVRGSLLAGGMLLAACGGTVAASSNAAGPASRGEVLAAAALASAPASAGDWTRFGYDAQRSGVGPAGTGIGATDLVRLQVRTVPIDGTVDSAPIQLHAVRVRGRSRDIVVATTSYGRTIALDAGSGSKLWEYVPPAIGSYEGSSRVTNATPVADPDRRYVYAATPDGRVRKLSLLSGHEVRSAHWPAVVTLDAIHEKLASALNLNGRYVIAVTGGYLGDAPPYQGHVALIDRSSGRVQRVFNSLCSDRRRLIAPRSCPQSDSAIWGRAGAVVEPGSGRLLLATGNGPFDGRTAWGDSVLELSPSAGLLHNWTPTDQAQLSANDTDTGSTAPALLPVANGRRLAVQGGKDGQLKLLDLNRLNGAAGAAGPRLGGELQRISTPGGAEMLTAPVVWSHDRRTYLFVADDSGTAAYVLSGGSHPRLRMAWGNASPGTSPVLAGGLLYVFDRSAGRLEVRQPLSGASLASLPAATGHWNSPIVVGGRIVLPVGNYMDHARRGKIYIYHLPGR